MGEHKPAEHEEEIDREWRRRFEVCPKKPELVQVQHCKSGNGS
jgi:hypothetical protein